MTYNTYLIYSSTLKNTQWEITKEQSRKNWRHMTHETKENKTKTQQNMCWTPLYEIKQAQRK